MKITADQRRELERLARVAQPAYVRTKCLVLINLANGLRIREVSRIFRVSRQSVYSWQQRYLDDGAAGLLVRSGRGRKAKADLEELARFVRQSPRLHGVNRTRWTLGTLAATVPSLNGFSAFGVQKALKRAGYHYKRGQPRLHSPDPHYEVKKGLWTRQSDK